MPYCDRCNRWFPHDGALFQHQRDSVFHHICHDCDKDFPTWTGLKEHYVQSPRHHYCPRCNELHKSKAALDRHLVGFHDFCEKHRLLFHTAEGLRQHYIQSGDHSYCQFCSILFDSLEELLKHGELYHYVCQSCSNVFETQRGLLSHKECAHYYCKACDRVFTTKSNLEHHLNSSLHKPSTIKCIGRGCTKSFISISALILHAESGTCPGGITRKQVNDFAVRLDRQNIITNPNRLLTDSSGGRAAAVEDEYWATDRSWNGRGFECFLCYREFHSIHALNMHLRSPKHAAKIYRCPMQGCGMECAALSALIQHVERGGCGVGRSRQVADVMDQLTSNMRRIAL